MLREEKRIEGQARLSRIINDNAQRLERLVRDVLELGRRDRTSQEPVKLASFLENCLEELAMHERIDRAIFALTVEPNAVLLFDRAHLNQVLWNLLSNARRYSSGKPGAIRIEARSMVPSGRLELHIMDDGAGWTRKRGARFLSHSLLPMERVRGLGCILPATLPRPTTQCSSGSATSRVRISA
ncbi:MAG: HAMP domain-containing histidine kinase [Rhodocyclaceae bacterium]|nr:HAMP domain-containing histidine kinase [Rhodocyclaceae bacterium]